MKNKTIFEDIQRAIISHCEQTLSRIESESLSTIEKFYIGKAFIKQRRKPGGRGFIKFDHMDTNTWKKNGIGSRWATHKKEEYGRDGLIVLTAISRDCVLQTNPHKKLHQEHFTLALEQTLIHHYRFKPNETRLENNSFNTGGVGSNKTKAYCVYVESSDYLIHASRMKGFSADFPSNTMHSSPNTSLEQSYDFSRSYKQ